MEAELQGQNLLKYSLPQEHECDTATDELRQKGTSRGDLALLSAGQLVQDYAFLLVCKNQEDLTEQGE